MSKRILLIEDFEMSSTLLSRTLTACRDVVVDIAQSAEEALVMVDAATDRYDIIITDIQMEGIGGLAFIKLIRDIEQEKGLTPHRTVAMSADRVHENSAIEAGANHFFYKYDNPVRKIITIIDESVPAAPAAPQN